MVVSHSERERENEKKQRNWRMKRERKQNSKRLSNVPFRMNLPLRYFSFFSMLKIYIKNSKEFSQESFFVGLSKVFFWSESFEREKHTSLLKAFAFTQRLMKAFLTFLSLSLSLSLSLPLSFSLSLSFFLYSFVTFCVETFNVNPCGNYNSSLRYFFIYSQQYSSTFFSLFSCKFFVLPYEILSLFFVKKTVKRTVVVLRCDKS